MSLKKESMEKHQFKILSIDGGGIRGIIPCTILKFIEDQTGSPLSDTFDLMAGTSTGGIITLGLTMQDEDGKNAYYADDMLNLYVKHGKDIFKERKQDFLTHLTSGLNISAAIAEPLMDIFFGLGSKITGATEGIIEGTNNPYDEAHIERILYEKFGDATLHKSLTDVLVTTYEISKGKAFYFLSRLAKEEAARVKKGEIIHKEKAENQTLWEIARSTSAAPTYFTPSLVRWKTETEVFIDGGVFANNPSVLAYGEAKELWKRRATLAFEPDVMPDDKDYPFFMLSLGTGYYPQYISPVDANKWRTFEWIKPLLTNVFMTSVASSTHYTMQHLLPKYTDSTPRYERFEGPVFEGNSQMDDVSPENIDYLQEEADKYVKDNKEDLKRICDYLRK